MSHPFSGARLGRKERVPTLDIKQAKKTLDRLEDVFSYDDVFEAMKRESALTKPTDSRVRNRIDGLLRRKAIKSIPHPDDGRKVLYQKLWGKY